MKTFFKNDKGVSTVAGILIILMFSLTFSSVAISYFSLSIYGQSTVDPLSFPTGIQSYAQEQNFQGCEFDKSTWLAPRDSTWTSECGVGEVLTSLTMSHAYSWILLANQQIGENGVVVNNYVINNTNLEPYAIAIRYTASLDHLEVRVDTDGFHIPNYVLPNLNPAGQAVAIGDLYFFPYQGASQIQFANIRTNFNNLDNSLTFTFNEQSFTATGLKGEGVNPLGIFTHYYGGVGSNSLGFTVSNFITDNQISLSSDTSFLNMALNFVTTMLRIIVWTVPEDVLPLFFNLLFIKTQLSAIVICLIVIARG